MRCCSFSNTTTESANAVQFVSNPGCKVPWVFSLRILELDTYQWQWRNCNAVFESSRQLRAFPSNIGHQQLLSTWEVWHFEASDPTFRACNVQCPHGSSSRLLQVHELLFPILLQADANPLPNPAHWRVFSEWAWLELLVDK